MSDLVERLQVAGMVLDEAATRIQELEAENANMKAAIEAFLEVSSKLRAGNAKLRQHAEAMAKSGFLLSGNHRDAVAAYREDFPCSS